MPAVLAWRLGRIIGAAAQARHVDADEAGHRHAEMIARIGSSPPTRTAAARFAALRDRLGPDRIGRRPSINDLAAAEAVEDRSRRALKPIDELRNP